MGERKKRILILANSSSGLLEFRGELIKALSEQGYEVSASLPELEEKERLEKLGCRVIHTLFARKGMNPFKDYGLLRTYKRLVKENRPAVVLTYTIKPNIYGGMACAALKVPCFANITGLGSALENPGLLGKLAAFLYRMGLKKDAVVFVQNPSNREFVLNRRLAKEEQVRLLPGSGVNLEHFALLPFPSDVEGLPDASSAQAAPDSRELTGTGTSPRFGTETEAAGFLFVSRVMKEKGIEEFLTAAKKLKAEQPQHTFTILGACEEDYSEQLAGLVHSGVIEYPGKVPDTRPYLEKAQCQVHPSFYSEGMSNVCLEAAASGRAVITTDHPGCREAVVEEVSGYLVKPRDAAALENAMRAFLALSHEERRAMGLAGRKHMEEHFDRRIVVNEYLEMIRSLKNC